VGRDEEIAMLMRRWERARNGDGQLVLIVGEPGIDKSGLLPNGTGIKTGNKWPIQIYECDIESDATSQILATPRRNEPRASLA
jgi:hypothetical protein